MDAIYVLVYDVCGVEVRREFSDRDEAISLGNDVVAGTDAGFMVYRKDRPSLMYIGYN